MQRMLDVLLRNPSFRSPVWSQSFLLLQLAQERLRLVSDHRAAGIHANFFVNPGGVGTATAADVMALIEHVQVVVEEKFGVRLQPEVQLAGEW